jgi:hypothetical protein
LRRRYRLGDRRFAFKGLGDRRKSGALPAFLSAADVLNGLCATVLVDRSIESLFVKQGRLDLSRPEAQAYAGYGVDTFERLLRTVHFLSFFLGGLSAAGQDVLWITDQDEIAANAERLTDLTSIVAHILGHYAPHDWGHLPCATTASDNGTLETEDLTAIADLTAGALAEMATAHADQGTFPGGAVIAPPPARLSRKARTVIEWFSIPGMPLRRLACAITSVQGSSKLTATVLRFHWGPALSSLGFE